MKKIEPNSLIADYFRITLVQKAALKKLGILTMNDLLYHFPARYGDTAEARNIDSLRQGETAVIFGKIDGLKASKGFKTKMTMAEAYIEDETGKIQCVWFNQPYIAKMFADGMLVRIEGKVSERRRRSTMNVADGPENRLRPEQSWSHPERLARVISRTVVAEKRFSGRSNALYFSNPKIERVDKLPTGVGDSLFGDNSEAHTLYPVYPESRGITSLWLYHAIRKIFKSGVLDDIPEPIPADILEKYHLPVIKTAFIWIHAPLNNQDALSARKRFAFEEVFTIQLGKRQARKEYEQYPAPLIENDPKQSLEFIRRFPFQATFAQLNSIDTILNDMKLGRAMSRLLEGDVGSGKTAVAAATAYAVITSNKKRTSNNQAIAVDQQPSTINYKLLTNYQVAYMCPTEILAYQHFESFIQYFAYLGIQIGLITSSSCRKFPSKVNPKGWTDISRAQLLKWVANGEIPILIGTHALIQKSVQFKNLAYVIIDEQHRFGTAQRAKLVKKNGNSGVIIPASPVIPAKAGIRGNDSKSGSVGADPRMRGDDRIIVPHLLSMTATPIPRTLALTMYGDLDLSLLDQSPAGRKPIITEIVLPNHRDQTYEKVRRELQAGRQAYVICPRINEPDPDKEQALNAKSVKEESKRLKTSVFPEYNIGILHSKMKPKEKDSVMMDFKNGLTNILCATSVVEVGVNVPNATVIIIEGAERFGLAQLHQLRGRVLRSSNQAYCYAFTETLSKKSIDRLHALQTAKNGFELAELDLAQRGAGQFSGLQQWGVSDIAMEALKNLKMVEAARTEATRLIDENLNLTNYPTLKKKVEEHKKEAHFE